MSYKRAYMSQICPKYVLYYILYSYRPARIMRRGLMRVRYLIFTILGILSRNNFDKSWNDAQHAVSISAFGLIK